MEELVKLAKNEKIRQTTLATQERHSLMDVVVYEMKIDISHSSKSQKEFLYRLFLEAKWLYNYQLSTENVFDIDYKLKEVSVLNKDKELEIREIHLSSQIKQELLDRTKRNISALSSSKKKGNSVGSLKFKSYVNSIPLKQYNVTYKIKSRHTIKIQGCKKPFKVKGLAQIPKEADLTEATLINKYGDFFIKITCFINKIPKVVTNKSIGLDFGIKDNITSSEGDKFNFSFPEDRRIKKLSRKLHKAKKGSKNRYKVRIKLARAYFRLQKKKQDTINKFVSWLLKTYDHICIQDENIQEWKSSKMKGWGKRIHHSIMGGIISKLKKSSETIIIDKFIPTTQLCPSCGTLNKHDLELREYSCLCGYHEDRDIHAAKNILLLGLSKISTEHRNTMPIEKLSSTLSGTSETLKASDFNEVGS